MATQRCNVDVKADGLTAKHADRVRRMLDNFPDVTVPLHVHLVQRRIAAG